MIEMTDERIYELAKRHFGGRGHSLIWQDDPRYAASCEMEKDARWSVSSVRAEQTLAFARSILAVSTEKTAPQLMESGPTGTDGSQKPNDAAAIPCAKAGSINSLPDSEIERIYRAEWYDSPVVARKAPSPPPLVFRFARACIAAHEAKKQQVHLVSASGGGTVPGDRCLGGCWMNSGEPCGRCYASQMHTFRDVIRCLRETGRFVDDEGDATSELSDLMDSMDARRANGLAWAVSRWQVEVAQRPLVNVHRRTLDDTWRQVVRYFGGDPVKLIGPAHDELVAAGVLVPNDTSALEKPLSECREEDLVNHHALVYGRTLVWYTIGGKTSSHWSDYAWWKAMWFPHRGPPSSSAAWGVYGGSIGHTGPSDADLSHFLPMPPAPGSQADTEGRDQMKEIQ